MLMYLVQTNNLTRGGITNTRNNITLVSSLVYLTKEQAGCMQAVDKGQDRTV